MYVCVAFLVFVLVCLSKMSMDIHSLGFALQNKPLQKTHDHLCRRPIITMSPTILLEVQTISTRKENQTYNTWGPTYQRLVTLFTKMNILKLLLQSPTDKLDCYLCSLSVATNAWKLKFLYKSKFSYFPASTYCNKLCVCVFAI